jgi:preprotein translocase subunit SecB
MKKSSFKIISQRLKDVKYFINTDFEFLKNKQVSLEMDFSTKINKHAEKPIAEVLFTLKLFGKSDNAPFTGEITYQGLFEWEKDTPPENVDKYLNYNAAALLYSYIRPVITNLTAMSNLPPLTIPFMNFQPDKKQ